MTAALRLSLRSLVCWGCELEMEPWWGMPCGCVGAAGEDRDHGLNRRWPGEDAGWLAPDAWHAESSLSACR